MSTSDIGTRIAKRARRAGLNLSPELAAQLGCYYRLLARWNEKINLTAFELNGAGQDAAVDRLLIEPVVASGHAPAGPLTVLDVGSGGGSPALPFRLALPSARLRMVESKTRKAVFLREAVRELNLADATVETARFEELLARPELHEAADVVTIRAVRVEPRTLVTIQALLKPGGKIFLFRGPGGADLSDALMPPVNWTATYPLIESLRSRLVVLTKNSVGRQTT